MRRIMIGAVVVLMMVSFADAKTVTFAGRTWTVRPNGTFQGPGNNNWNENNAWVDSSGQLHLKISKGSDGKWYCAEVYTTDYLGFGKYQWYVIGRLDTLDKSVVLGLFPYKGPDGLNEIDIEIAKWGSANTKGVGNFTVYPAVTGISSPSFSWKYLRWLLFGSKKFTFTLTGDYTTHRFNWQSKSVYFQMLHGHRTDNSNQIADYNYAPSSYTSYIPQQAMRTHMNLWLYNPDKDKPAPPPSNGQNVEIIIRNFTYTK